MAGILDGLSPQLLGLLSLSLMQAAQPSTTPQSVNIGGLLSNLASERPQNISQQPQVTPSQQIHNPLSRIQSAFGTPSNTSNNSQSDMITQLKATAEATYPNDPKMQQVAISQAILESGLNPSKLATKYNNYFGIKGNDTTLPTTEYSNGNMQNVKAGFESNNSMADSFNQHRDLINKRYQKVTEAASPYDAFNQLQTAGYATDPRYAKKLSSVYDRYVQPLYNLG